MEIKEALKKYQKESKQEERNRILELMKEKRIWLRKELKKRIEGE